jgi:hypothetical protein
MEAIISSAIVPWAGSLIGFTFALSMITALVALVMYGGLYYSITRSIVKALGQAAMTRIA